MNDPAFSMKIILISVLASFESRWMGLVLIGGIFFMQSCAQMGPMQVSPEALIEQGRWEEAMAALDAMPVEGEGAMTMRSGDSSDMESFDKSSDEIVIPGRLEKKTDLLVEWRRVAGGSEDLVGAGAGSAGVGRTGTGSAGVESGVRSGRDVSPINPQHFYKGLREEIEEFGVESSSMKENLASLWSLELQEGVQWLQMLKRQDGLVQDGGNAGRSNGVAGAGVAGVDLAVADVTGADVTGLQYFQWAIDLMPDSVVAYRLKSTAHYKLGQTDKAMETLEALWDRSREKGQGLEGLEDDLMEQLAYLYLESGRLEAATNLYEELLDRDPKNRLWKHGFVNSLLLAGERERAIEWLEGMVAEEPSYLPYRKTLLSEQVRQVSEEMVGMMAVEGVVDMEHALDRKGGEGVVTAAEGTLEGLLELLSNQEAEEDPAEMGTFFTGLGNLLPKAGNAESRAEDGDKAVVASTERLRNRCYEAAIPYWLKLQEIDPENQWYAQQLYRLYTELSMTNEAELLHQRMNF